MTKRIEHVCNDEVCPDEHCDPVNEMKKSIRRKDPLTYGTHGATGGQSVKLKTADPSGYGEGELNRVPSVLQQSGRIKHLTHDFNKLSKQIHADNVKVGWWDNPDPCLLEKLQMVSTEIAEATEGERRDLMDDKLPHRKMGEVELADTLIRVLDLGGKLSLKYLSDTKDYSMFKHMVMDMEKTKSIAGKHFIISRILAIFGSFIEVNHLTGTLNLNYSVLIESIMEVGKFRGYDIISAVHEKLAYNRKRADHKRENRAKEHGKKF